MTAAAHFVEETGAQDEVEPAQAEVILSLQRGRRKEGSGVRARVRPAGRERPGWEKEMG